MRSRLVPAVVLLALLAPVAGIALPVAGTGAGSMSASDGAGGSAATAGVVAPADGAARVDAAGPAPPNLTRPDPALVMTIDLRANGDARWRVASRFRLRNETERAAFRALARAVRNGEAPAAEVGYSAATFRRFVDRATGEGMRIENASWSSRVDRANGTGTLALTFTWTNFADARANGSKVVLDDVFRSTDGGTWFPSLAPDHRLVIDPPAGYAPTTNTLGAPIQNGSIRIDGPWNFSAGAVRLVYEPTDVDPPTTTPANNTTGNGPETGGGLPSTLLGGGLFVLAAGAALVGYFLLYRTPDPGNDGAVTDGKGGVAAGSESDGTTNADGGAEAGGGTADGPRPDQAADAGDPSGDGAADPATPEDATSGAGPAGDATGGQTADAPDGPTVDAAGTEEGDGESEAGDEGTDVELLSDEERVERLLEENGGRMKQANIVTETGWSNAKVSQLLSSMDEDDRIDKLRIGRENLITLPDEDVGEIG